MLLLLIVAFTCRLGWWPVAATATPPAWESKIGQSMLRASLGRQARGLTNPFQASNEVLVTGMQTFKGVAQDATVNFAGRVSGAPKIFIREYRNFLTSRRGYQHR